MDPTKVKDVLIRTSNPAYLDETVQQLGGALVGGPDNFVTREGYYVMRCFNPMLPDMVKQQGYAEVVRELDELV